MVRQWTGAAWAYLRKPPTYDLLADEDTSFTYGNRMALATAGGNLYVAYLSSSDSDSAKVLQWNGDDWTLGERGLRGTACGGSAALEA